MVIFFIQSLYWFEWTYFNIWHPNFVLLQLGPNSAPKFQNPEPIKNLSPVTLPPTELNLYSLLSLSDLIRYTAVSKEWQEAKQARIAASPSRRPSPGPPGLAFSSLSAGGFHSSIYKINQCYG